MARGLNRVEIIGYLGSDPDVRYTQNNSRVCNLSVATTEQWKDKAGNKQEETEWHRIVLWNALAEIAEEYLTKGSLVFVAGKLKTRKWTDKDGNDRYSTDIIGRDFQMLGGGEQKRNERIRSDRDRPDRSRVRSRRRRPEPEYDEVEYDDDDIPF